MGDHLPSMPLLGKHQCCKCQIHTENSYAWRGRVY